MTLRASALPRRLNPVLAGLVLGLSLTGCSSDAAMWNADWAWWRSKPPVTAASRTMGPDAFVGPDGACPAPEGEQVSRGIGLGMTECELVRLVGPTDRIEITTNDRGERTTVITYPQGERAGIYRFTSGQLTTMDRIDEPPVSKKPQPKKPAPKKPATPKPS